MSTLYLVATVLPEIYLEDCWSILAVWVNMWVNSWRCCWMTGESHRNDDVTRHVVGREQEVVEWTAGIDGGGRSAAWTSRQQRVFESVVWSKDQRTTDSDWCTARRVQAGHYILWLASHTTTSSLLFYQFVFCGFFYQFSSRSLTPIESGWMLVCGACLSMSATTEVWFRYRKKYQWISMIDMSASRAVQ